MIDFEEQQKLLMAIGNLIKRKISVYIIGGSAMLYYQSKINTKDIDLVVTEKKDFDDVKNAFKKLGFYEKKPFLNIKYLEPKIEVNKPTFLVLGEKRIDIFLKEIICFKLTESIKERIREVHEYNNLIVKVISPEDIILLKCATDRKGDRLDAKSLIDNFNINWDIIIKETEHQVEIGQDVFPVYLFDFLEELKEDLKADIPKEVIKKIMKIAERQMIKVLKGKKHKKHKKQP